MLNEICRERFPWIAQDALEVAGLGFFQYIRRGIRHTSSVKSQELGQAEWLQYNK